MNCEDFDRWAVSLACELPLDDLSHRNAYAHTQHCANCSAKLTRQMHVTEGLRQLMTAEQQINAPAWIGTALQEAFERQASILPAAPRVPARASFWSTLHWRWAAVAVATILLLALTAVFWRRAPQSTPEIVTVPRLEAPLPQVVVPVEQKKEIPQEKSSTARVITRATAKPQAPRPAHSLRNEENEEGEFFSLRTVAPTEPSEFEQVVRMQIPRTTLALWGVRVNEENDSQKVNAEVVFGEDGVARAIRILN